MKTLLSPELEKQLSDRLAKGDREALSTLYSMHAALILSVVLRMVKSRPEAEDLVQETFLEAWRRATHYEPARANVVSWLVTIAKSRAIDKLRNRQVVKKVHDKEEQEPRVVTEDLAELLHRKRKAEAVRKALETLPDTQRTLIELAWNKGLSQSEIAQSTGIPLGTVKTRTRQALLSISASLEVKK